MSANADNLRRRAFTLVEVMLGLVILVIVTGGAFAVVQSALTSTQVAGNLYRKYQAADALTQYFRRLFLTLQPSVKFTCVLSENDPPRQILTFASAPEVLAWGKGRDGPPDTRVRFIAETLAGGNLALVARKEFPREPAAVYPPPAVLVDGLDLWRWEFLDPRTDRWQDTWTDAATRPKAVRLRFRLRDLPEETRVIFALSPVPPIST